MSNYTKATNFAAKDSLPSGNAAKVVKGTEIDNEFEAIETALATKADLASPTFTGTPEAPTPSTTDDSTNLATTEWVRDVVFASGAVLQEVSFTDAGSSTTSSSRTNVTGSAKSITPKSSNSTLIVECSFQGQVTAGGAGTNTQGAYQLYNVTTSSTVGAEYTLGTLSGTGANLQTEGMGILRASITNAATTAVSFQLVARYAGLTAATVAATSHVWTIREIQN